MSYGLLQHEVRAIRFLEQLNEKDEADYTATWESF